MFLLSPGWIKYAPKPERLQLDLFGLRMLAVRITCDGSLIPKVYWFVIQVDYRSMGAWYHVDYIWSLRFNGRGARTRGDCRGLAGWWLREDYDLGECMS